MLDPEQPGGSGNQYQNIRINEGAKAQLGDIYHISREDPLSLLPSATHASYNSYDRQHEPTCLPDTRVDLLQEIYEWADGQNGQSDRCIFWLNGLAGTGKSTISRTVARRYNEQKRLGASFFFSKGDGDVSHAGKFVTSLAVQLAKTIPSLQKQIYAAIAKESNIANMSLSDQWRLLVLGPLSRLEESPQSYILVVDALDECEGDNDVRRILELLAEARSLKTVQLRVFLTSRPEIPIRHSMHNIPQAEHQDFLLHNVPSPIVDNDISLFLEYNLGIIRQECSLGEDWPGKVVLTQLVHKSSGVFIWAATACRFISEGEEFADDRLVEILEGTSSEGTPEQHLDQMYLTVLQSSMPNTFRAPEKVRFYAKQRKILGSIAILLSPLPAASLAKVISISGTQVTQTLERLQAILEVPKDIARFPRLHHPSFRDFLLNKDRCGDFWVNEKEAHQTLATGCIQLMSQTLKKDICEMHAPGSQVSQVESSCVEKCLPPEVQYACLYWVQHLQRSGSQVQSGDEAHQFLQTHLLHWLEALGWMGKTSEGIQAILSLEAHVPVDESPNLHAFIRDAKRFALYNRLVIEQTPLQLYCSALVFAPEQSIIWRQFEKCIPPWIQMKTKMQENRNAALQTLEGHLSLVYSVAFSPDGKQVASGSGDMTIRLWDAATGAELQTLKGHSERVYSVAFSPDGKQVASGSRDKTVRLWDAATGAELQTLKGHSERVYSVDFSPDGKQVASGSRDKTVRLWDAATGAELQALKGHSGRVHSVAFSPDGKQVASGSGDMTIRLWDAATGAELQTLKGHSEMVYSVAFSPDGKELQTLKGHSGRVHSVAFSPDGKQVASGSGDKTVRLWDAATGVELQTLKGHSNLVYSVAFSPDGKQVASGSGDKTVRLWDAATGAELQTLKGHSEWVYSVAFSPDRKQVASGSGDMTVRLWDPTTGVALQTLKGHSGRVHSVAISLDSKQVALGSPDKTVRLWDAATGVLLQTLKGHSGWVHSVAFSPDGKQVVSGSGDKTVRLWDAATGVLLQTLKGHSGWVSSVAFSPDGKQVASGSRDMTVQLWDAATGAALQTLKGHSSFVYSVAISLDSKQVASGSGDKTVRLWDAATGVLLQTLKGHSGWVRSVAFSPDGKQVASGSRDKTVQLWDAATGAALQTLKGHSSLVNSVFLQGSKVEQALNLVNSVAFSPDGKQFALGSDDKTVRLWDSATGALLQTLKGHSCWVIPVAFSPDGKQVASGSYDKTVRLWDVATGAALQTLKGHSNWVNSLAFSPDGKQVASGSYDNTVRLWDAATGAALQMLEGHSGTVYSVAFSPDGKQVASGSHDNTVRLWDSVTGAALQMLKSHSRLVKSVFLQDNNVEQGLFVSDCWVMEGKEKILWIPPEYRSTSMAVWNGIIVFGLSSEIIIILRFKQGLKLI